MASTFRTILAADWSGDRRKRRCVRVDFEERSIRLQARGDSLKSLLATARLATPSLVAIDAAIGIPVELASAAAADSFLSWLTRAPGRGDFWREVTSAEDWQPDRPFWRNPSGDGAQIRFFDRIGERFPSLRRGDDRPDLLRESERRTRGKCSLCTSNLPGAVGSATRALWRELLSERSSSSLWPFDGSLSDLLSRRRTIVAEIYPSMMYGIATADELPAQSLMIAKTKHAERSKHLPMALLRARELGLVVSDEVERAALVDEDCFDALISAIALTRLLLRGDLAHEDEMADPRFEGSMLGRSVALAGAVSRRRSPRSTSVSPSNLAGFQCPIAGCRHQFAVGRLGWDSHVGSYRRHPWWHPGERDAGVRKHLFRAEFPYFWDRQ